MLEFIYSHMSLQTLIWLIVALPLAGALINGAMALATARSEKTRFRGFTSLVGLVTTLAAFAATCILFVTLTGFEAGSPSAITGPIFRWFAAGRLYVDVGLKADELSLIMALLISGVATLVQIYSIGCMWEEEGYLRFFSLSSAALFFMLLAVMADNLVLMLVGWEGVGLISCAMIGFRFSDRDSIRASLRAFIANAVGDACLLAAIFLVFGAMSASEVDPHLGLLNFETMERYGAYFVPVATSLALLAFAGAVAKSAQIPLFVWMPGSARAPIPAFALINTVTMAAAGVYLVVRMNFVFALSPTALTVVAVVGAASALLAATMALAEKDVRRILAYSTISQFGFMYLAVGIGAFTGAIFHLVTHALFKALLILAAGSAIKAAGGEADITKMGGLKRRMPVTAWSFLIASVALAGIAPASGFFSQQAIMGDLFERGHWLLWMCGFAAVGVTAFYIFRAVGSIFFGDSRMSQAKLRRLAEPQLSMVVPMMLLMTLVAFGGIVGVPRCLGGSDMISRWLGGLIPSEMSRAPGDGSCGTWIVLAAVTLLWSAHFAVLGWLIYAQKRDWPERVARKIKPLVTLVSRRFYVDELYDFAIVRPLGWLARGFVNRGIDRTVVDGIVVDGTARSVGLMASLVQATQTGTLHHYMLYFLIGAIVIIALVAL